MLFQPGIRISRRRVFLLTCDIVCIAGSIVMSSFIRLSPGPGWGYLVEHLPTMIGSCLIFLLVFYAGGMYEQQAVRRKMSSFIIPLVTVSIGLMIIILVFYARFKLHLGRGILLLAGLFIFASTWLVRRLYRLAVGYGLFLKNTLVVGEGKDIPTVLHLLSKSEDANFKLFGIVSSQSRRSEDFIEGIPMLGSTERLKEFVDVYAIETIIMATSFARGRKLFRVLRPLRYSGVEIMDYVALHEELAQEIPLDHINDEWLMSAAMNSSVVHIRKIKRVMDVAVSIIGLILSLPITVITAVLVKLNSPGPVLYRQERVGLDGRPYILNKFRTMKHNAEAESGAVWAGQHDSRVTRVGQFLRKWRFDEIPQLLNVLKGEMSLVGPRPERPEFVETLSLAIPFYKERLLVPPGITGWAQVKYPYAASIDASRRKLQYDLYYIKHMSFVLDVLILLRTFKTIIIGLKYEDQTADADLLPSAVVPLKVGIAENAHEGSA
ncbi:MAG: hypothetical protein A2X46_04855 [Lentisphaerae bacterium GWF2_57_35]|nr:MAG: hypothetical protein A2X46_04855 [Lentisphaerae bacterium GWF2_57_35]